MSIAQYQFNLHVYKYVELFQLVTFLDSFYLIRQKCLTVKYTTKLWYVRDPSGIFSISSLVRILMTSFSAFSWLFVQTVSLSKKFHVG